MLSKERKVTHLIIILILMILFILNSASTVSKIMIMIMLPERDSCAMQILTKKSPRSNPARAERA